MNCYPDNIIWPDPSVLPPAPVDPDNPTPEEVLQQQQLEVATELGWTTLQTLSGYAFTLCPTTVRPCHDRTWYRYEYGLAIPGPFFPYNYGGLWYNNWCLDDNCSCNNSATVTLPEAVTSIVSVHVDGVLVDPAAYRVDDGTKLVRQDGGVWPFRQNYLLPDSEVGTFSVTYTIGLVTDVALRYAVGIMATEYLQAMLGGDCRLPAGTVQMVRAGLTVEFQPDFFQGSRTGIPEVDAVVARLNPFGAKGKSVMFNPDAKRARQTTFGG